MVGYQLVESFNETSKNLFCGGAAGSLGIFVGHPCDLIKIRLQMEPTRYPSAVSCLLDTVRQEGFLSLYRGLAAPMAAQFLQNALIFAGESVALRYLEPDMKFQSEMSSKTVMHVFLAGSFGGLLQCAVLVPADLIKCKLQVDLAHGKRTYSGNLDCIRQIYRSEGIGGFYKGLGVTALREVPAFGVYFFVYRYTLRMLSSTSTRCTASDETNPRSQLQPQHLQKPQTRPHISLSSPSQRDLSALTSSSGTMDLTLSADPSVGDDGTPGLATLIAGGLAGCSSWLLIYPVDVVKVGDIGWGWWVMKGWVSKRGG